MPWGWALAMPDSVRRLWRFVGGDAVDVILFLELNWVSWGEVSFNVHRATCAQGLWASIACGLCRLRPCIRRLLGGDVGGVRGWRGGRIGGF